MDRTGQAEQRVRQLLELAHQVAGDYFAKPSDDLVAMIFSQLCAEGETSRFAAAAQVATGTVH